MRLLHSRLAAFLTLTILLLGSTSIVLAFEPVVTVELEEGQRAEVTCPVEQTSLVNADGSVSIMCGDTPVAGTSCPDWVHNLDIYKSGGYPSWHPQVTPTNSSGGGCIFNHDHGSDPADFGDGQWKPQFGVVGQAAHHAESHIGWKLQNITAAMKTAAGATVGTFDFMYLTHMGTTVQSRACIASHEVALLVANHTDQPTQLVNAAGETVSIGAYELVYESKWLGHFGEARTNLNNDRIPLSSCIDPVTGHLYHEPRGIETININGVDYVNYAQTVGERHLSTFDPNIAGSTANPSRSVGYEPWIIDHTTTDDYLGAMIRGLSVNIHSSASACVDTTCRQVEVYFPLDEDLNGDGLDDDGYTTTSHGGTMVQGPLNPNNRHGAYRTIVWNSSGLFGVKDVSSSTDGYYTTNVFGDGPADASGSVLQYAKPGLELYFVEGGRRYPQEPLDGSYDKQQQTWFGRPDMNPEDALRAN